MPIRKKTLIGILLVIVLALGGNLAYRSTQILKEPVFLTHYYEQHLYGMNSQLELYYFTNANDDATVTQIRFPELPDEIADWPQVEGSSTMGIYGPHRFNHISVTLDRLQFDGPDVTLTKAEITLSDGRCFTTELGKIMLTNFTATAPNLLPTLAYSVFSQSTVGGSEGMVSETRYQIKEDCDLSSMYSILSEESPIVTSLDVPVPTSLSAGDMITVQNRFCIPKDEVCLQYVFEIRKQLIFTTADGRTASVELFNLGYTPDFSNPDLLRAFWQRVR